MICLQVIPINKKISFTLKVDDYTALKMSGRIYSNLNIFLTYPSLWLYSPPNILWQTHLSNGISTLWTKGNQSSSLLQIVRFIIPKQRSLSHLLSDSYPQLRNSWKSRMGQRLLGMCWLNCVYFYPRLFENRNQLLLELQSVSCVLVRQKQWMWSLSLCLFYGHW